MIDEENETFKMQLDNMESKPIIVKLAKSLLFPSKNVSSLNEKILFTKSKYSYFNYYTPNEIDEIVYVF